MVEREILNVPGYAEQSIWGYDEMMQSYYAQIWRDGSTSSDPEVWISGMQPITSISELIYVIAARLGLDPTYVDECMSEDPSGSFENGDDRSQGSPVWWKRILRLR